MLKLSPIFRLLEHHLVEGRSNKEGGRETFSILDVKGKLLSHKRSRMGEIFLSPFLLYLYVYKESLVHNRTKKNNKNKNGRDKLTYEAMSVC